MSVEPISTKLKLPSAYGAPSDSPLLDWSSVVDRLVQAEHYWLSTADQHAAPIARPLDGVWLEGAFYFGGDPATRWRRNLAKNPRACLSIDDTSSPVILEGSVSVESLSEKDAEKVAVTTRTKYGWGATEQFQVETCVFTPLKGVAWIGLFENATRFQFVD